VFDAGKWDPTVALRIASVARHRGVRLLHATGVKGTLAARIAARLICVARNGVPLEALRQSGAGARSQVRAELDIEPGGPRCGAVRRRSSS